MSFDNSVRGVPEIASTRIHPFQWLSENNGRISFSRNPHGGSMAVRVDVGCRYCVMWVDDFEAGAIQDIKQYFHDVIERACQNIKDADERHP